MTMRDSRAQGLGSQLGKGPWAEGASTADEVGGTAPMSAMESDGEAPIVCLLTTLHPERALSRALVQHLVQEMPDIVFTLRPIANVAVIWVCGYEKGAGAVIRRLRAENPEAQIVATGRDPVTWQHEVLQAGADHACGWPIPYSRLNQLFHEPRLRTLG